ncbi:MAG: hypothetical protein SFV22_08670 [Saprospiraceae bacterium]|nr:hypothetical protein [Saprospiraceae bacterium]
MVVKADTIYINANYRGVSGLEYTVLKFDLQGNYRDRFDYWHPGLENFHSARNLQTHQDRFFVHGTYKDTTTLRIRDNVWVYDAEWNKLWETNVPNNGYPRLSYSNSAATDDGGLAVIYASFKIPGYRTVATIEKYDAEGQLEWRSTLPYEFDIDRDFVNIAQHPDGGYMGVWKVDTFGGFHYRSPDLIFKLDADGQLVWERIYYEQINNFYDIFVTQNGDLVGCGVTEDSPFDTITEPDFIAGYIARFNADGERLWERRIIEKRADTWFCELYGGVEMPNGDLVFTGSIDDTTFFPDPYPQNVWLLRVDGNVASCPTARPTRFYCRPKRRGRSGTAPFSGYFPYRSTSDCCWVPNWGKLFRQASTGQPFTTARDRPSSTKVSTRIVCRILTLPDCLPGFTPCW